MNQNFQMYPTYNPPYLQQIPYQPQQAMQINNIPGKMVDDFSMVGANDVPMDGNASVFLKRDLSEIQIRKWGSDGRIYSTTYKPFTEELNNPVKEDNFSGINERLIAIEDKIDKLFKPTTTTKKGAADVNN